MADAFIMFERGAIVMGLIGKVFSFCAAVLLPGGIVILCAFFFGRAFREAWLENAQQTLPVRVKTTVRSMSLKRVWRETTRRW